MLHTIVFKVLEVLQFFILLGIRFIKIFTARKRSLESKVMFLHLSVILFTGGGGSVSKGVSVGGALSRDDGGLCPGDLGRGGGVFVQEQGGFSRAGSLSRGVSVREPPPPVW